MRLISSNMAGLGKLKFIDIMGRPPVHIKCILTKMAHRNTMSNNLQHLLLSVK